MPLEEADPRLRQRVVGRARMWGRFEQAQALLTGLRRFWPAGAAALVGASAAALALVVVLDARVDDLNDENDRLKLQFQETDAGLEHQQQITAMLAASDVERIAVDPTEAMPSAVATYYRSYSVGRAAIVCNNLRSLEPGQTYQLWLFVGEHDPVSAGTFTPSDGVAHHVVDLERLDLEREPMAVGVSIEPAGGSERPTSRLVLFAPLPQE
ncbi:MAG: anti-sigma factor [Chloroflexi bacterium]|nr:anti-sigma factor [Chloroflexota bacterium]